MECLRDIIEVKELTDVEQVDNLLAGDWELLTVAPGQTVDKQPVVLYSLGRVYTAIRKDLQQW